MNISGSELQAKRHTDWSIAVHTAIPPYESETLKGIASHMPLQRGLR